MKIEEKMANHNRSKPVTSEQRVHNREHTILRLKERYKLNFNYDDYNTMCSLIRKRKSRHIHNISTYRSYKELNYLSHKIQVIWDSNAETIVTVLESHTDTYWYEFCIPRGLKNHPEWARERYNLIFETAQKEIKEMPKFEIDKETALYIQTKKYTRLLFVLWRNQPSKIKRIPLCIWNHVKEDYKIEVDVTFTDELELVDDKNFIENEVLVFIDPHKE